ncbi:hypothetical protein [Nocardia huaxiensis]|uniref:Uncharacterized protein n=1 Tax=Nocardia huaxiensis TaxID=2755382 RepID=A0A7D6VHR7_9NOCA|nr:hypothetical protein [Nocardia huaxiensis]QLY29870.1 hypothetical protein H0264_32420 [Nocardia huaxiensis]UFS96542.1 hypothetical protein LPY97_00950 [Nocardia huaxiensis]
MTRRRRIYSFPGGVLETNDYGDGNAGGVYVESCRMAQLWDQAEIRRPADRLGYDVHPARRLEQS